MTLNHTTQIETELERLANRFGIRLILQFGSTVAGTAHQLSDIDVAVMFERGDVPLRDLLEVSEELEKVFPAREIDVAVINRADPLFLKKITDKCSLLLGNPRDLARLRLHAFKQYQDYRRFLAIERKFVANRLAALTGRADKRM